jgi:hypothetical protein
VATSELVTTSFTPFGHLSVPGVLSHRAPAAFALPFAGAFLFLAVAIVFALPLVFVFAKSLALVY